MTFKQMQDAVLLNTFDETLRTNAKDWINTRYSWLCDHADWAFMRAFANVTVTSGSQAVSGLPTDFGIANGLSDQYGYPLRRITNPEEFVRYYMDTTTSYTGQPEAFTVFGSPGTFDGGLFGDGTFDGASGGIYVGPTSNVTSTVFRLLYERAAPLLSADGDTPIIPSGYHMGIVAGARALGCRLNGIADADAMESEFRSTIDAMRLKYLRPVRDRTPQSPAYRPR